jgi:hypothetical protein
MVLDDRVLRRDDDRISSINSVDPGSKNAYVSALTDRKIDKRPFRTPDPIALAFQDLF